MSQLEMREPRPVAPPHNIEAEQAVLGAILLADEAVLPRVLAQGLRPEDFYRDSHETIFAAMVGMYEDRRHIDVVTLAQYLRANGELEAVGGRAAVDLLALAVHDAGHLTEYARIVIDCAYLRRMARIAHEILNAVQALDVAELRVLVGNAVALLPKSGPRAVEREAA